MHVAAQNNYVECMEVLCAHDADVGLMNYQNQTPLGCAKIISSLQAAEFLEVLTTTYLKIKPKKIISPITIKFPKSQQSNRFKYLKVELKIGKQLLMRKESEHT